MRTVAAQRRRWPRRAALGAAVAGLLTIVIAGSGLAAAKVRPANTSPPRIVGAARVGQVLTGERGSWTGNPTRYAFAWLRCDRNGGSCTAIGGATGAQYALVAADDGHTIRFRVTATNADGSATAVSAQSDVVVASGKPANTAAPTISGTPQENSTLTGTNGTWTNNPSKYEYTWLRCAANGSSCSAIGSATKNTYTLGSADIGTTLRFRVVASNSAGSDTAESAPTAVISKFRGQGCPLGGNPDQAAGINPPARLLVDTLQSEPPVVTGGIQTLVVRFHVTSTCGGPVQGALVYATATPYNQFAIPPEQPTGADGWATLTFQRARAFPASKQQQIRTMPRHFNQRVFTTIGESGGKALARENLAEQLACHGVIINCHDVRNLTRHLSSPRRFPALTGARRRHSRQGVGDVASPRCLHRPGKIPARSRRLHRDARQARPTLAGSAAGIAEDTCATGRVPAALSARPSRKRKSCT